MKGYNLSDDIFQQQMQAINNAYAILGSINYQSMLRSAEQVAGDEQRWFANAIIMNAYESAMNHCVLWSAAQIEGLDDLEDNE